MFQLRFGHEKHVLFAEGIPCRRFPRQTQVQIIDQRHLPHDFVVEDLRTVEEMCVAIKDGKCQIWIQIVGLRTAETLTDMLR